MGTHAFSSGAYSMNAVAFASSLRKTWPSLSRSASHSRLASTPEWGFFERMMQQRVLGGEVFLREIDEIRVHFHISS